MFALKWFLIAVVFIGVVLFLYGANYYDNIVGWVGVALVAASVVGLLLLYVYDELAKRNLGQKP
jgi:hypothetical protein